MRDMRFEFKLSEGEYLRMKKTAFVLGMTMADLIRDSLDLKCAEMEEGLNELLKEQEIVRCKDCVHWYFADNRIPSERENVFGRNGIVVTPDWFCADGERRTDA